jgi:hypothetical protein
MPTMALTNARGRRGLGNVGRATVERAVGRRLHSNLIGLKGKRYSTFDESGHHRRASLAHAAPIE